MVSDDISIWRTTLIESYWMKQMLDIHTNTFCPHSTRAVPNFISPIVTTNKFLNEFLDPPDQHLKNFIIKKIMLEGKKLQSGIFEDFEGSQW